MVIVPRLPPVAISKDTLSFLFILNNQLLSLIPLCQPKPKHYLYEGEGEFSGLALLHCEPVEGGWRVGIAYVGSGLSEDTYTLTEIDGEDTITVRIDPDWKDLGIPGWLTQGDEGEELIVNNEQK